MTRLAITQMPCGWNIEDNLNQAEMLVREAAGNGAQIILLQELFARYISAQSRIKIIFPMPMRLMTTPFCHVFAPWLKSWGLFCRSVFLKKATTPISIP